MGRSSRARVEANAEALGFSAVECYRCGGWTVVASSRGPGEPICSGCTEW